MRPASGISLFQTPDKIIAKVAAQTKASETKRRVKMLTVEGIQKRKNPNKNYVSKIFEYFIQ